MEAVSNFLIIPREQIDLGLLSQREKQSLFALEIARLVLLAYEMGYEVTEGHSLRCADCTTGRKNSLHKLKLAKDLNLFKDGTWLTETEDHWPLGEIWESWGYSWGGRFNDGNHYSIPHLGRR